MEKTVMKLTGLYLNALAIVAPQQAGRLGFKLFCRPFRMSPSDRHRAFLDAGKAFTFKHQSDHIQVYRWGRGAKKILLVHGWNSHAYFWKRYVEALDESQYSMYAFDAPGHGLSGGNFLSVPRYSNVIEALCSQIGPIDTMIGHSIGSFSILYTVYRKKGLAPEKIVMLAPPGEASEFFNFYQKRLQLSEKVMQLIVRRFQEIYQHGPSYFSAPKFAAHMIVPGIIIHDVNDDETSAESSKQIHQAWKNSDLLLTTGAGHKLRSQEVLQTVMRFVDKPVNHPV